MLFLMKWLKIEANYEVIKMDFELLSISKACDMVFQCFSVVLFDNWN